MIAEKYIRKAREWTSCPLSLLPKEILKRTIEVGVTSKEDERAGTYIQIDHSVIQEAVKEAFKDKVEVMSTGEALKKHKWLKKYWWKLIREDQDEYTLLAKNMWDQGYFLRVHEGEKVTLPLQSCLMISTNNLNQNVHNIIVAEPDSEAQIITGCTVHPNVKAGLHVGISEFYIKEGAELTFTMIHSWAENVEVRPRSAALIEEDASFISNYVCLRPVKTLQTYPAAYCKGGNSRVRFNSLLYGTGISRIDVGAKVVLEGEDSRGEVISRAIATEEADIHLRGLLIGKNSESRAHLECRGLLLSEKAKIHAIPELLAESKGAELSHEAAIGKIAEEQILYLMSRGFSRRESESLIIRGFMDVSILGLPEKLSKEIKGLIEVTAAQAL
ncbi:TPA: SufD family Fe-S cluster assembly protein [Candidatus Bathyarchaeota archaeon]|nr:SufD family Fe-S cluster assembly protein [Candidatus Bathyarchaeota archaeon]